MGASRNALRRYRRNVDAARRRLLLEDRRADDAAERRERGSNDEPEQKLSDDAQCGEAAVHREVAKPRRHVVHPFEQTGDELALERFEDERQRNRDDEDDDRTEHAGEKTDERAVAEINRRRMVLLEQVRRDRAAAEHPEAAAVA